MFSLKFAAHSEVGRVRKNNQDSGYGSPTLILVADGMGGAAAGDLASAVAVTELARADERLAGEQMLEALAGALSRANDTLSDLVNADPMLDGMGTTVCGAMFSGEQLGLVHIGDSRGYLLREGKLLRLTHDHSWVQSLIDEGKITPEQAETHPHRSLLLKVLNGQPVHEPDVELIDVREGDRVMFCSDGLCGLVPDTMLARLLAKPDLADAISALSNAANAAGGVDNITMVLADVVAQDADLDTIEPVLVGAVTEREIPEVAAATTASFPAVETPDEDERYAPEPRKSRWVGTTLIAFLTLTLISLGGWAGIAYTRTKYFVGADDTHVAIFQGIPGAFLGFRLGEVYEQQATLVADLPAFYQERVLAGIAVPGLDAAKATSAELHAKAQRCIEVRKQRTTQPTPTLGPTPSAEPTPSASLAPTLPTGDTTSPAATPTHSPYPNLPTDPGEC